MVLVRQIVCLPEIIVEVEKHGSPGRVPLVTIDYELPGAVADGGTVPEDAVAAPE